MVAAQADHAEASAPLAATASSAAADLQAMLAAERQAGGGIGNGSAATGVAEQASSLIQQAAWLQDMLSELQHSRESHPAANAGHQPACLNPNDRTVHMRTGMLP